MAPPGLPPERIAALCTAFDAMVKDPDFIAEMKKHDAPLDPLPGSELQRLVTETLSLPPSVTERAVQALKE
jgi:tripartite-type tricarboxylate transporter receptor subunit TctC